MATKRRFELSTGDSPGKPKPKLALREGSSRKSLFQTISQSSVSSRNKKPVSWTKQETCMLFINKYSIYVGIGKIPGTTNGQQPKIKSSGMDVPKQ